MPPDVADVRRRLTRWARVHDRPLPWRAERDPYRVLVSEVMLQQTQASRVVDAYTTFLERFPTVEVLAASHSADVLRAWGSLGYNRRAVNLWRAARAVVARGGFPDTIAGLEALPGVGQYTARAVASFAFGVRTAVVEANVRRIVTRLHGLTPDADVQDLADALVPRDAASWNQALMDLGAGVCTPRSPSCDACPLAACCAWANGVRHEHVRRPSESFESTTRYARGRVVRELRITAHAVTVTSLAQRTGLGADRTREAVRTLERDGIVSTSRGAVRLGAQRARERRRSTSATT